MKAHDGMFSWWLNEVRLDDYTHKGAESYSIWGP